MNFNTTADGKLQYYVWDAHLQRDVPFMPSTMANTLQTVRVREPGQTGWRRATRDEVQRIYDEIYNPGVLSAFRQGLSKTNSSDNPG